jgi:hypothetical protein
MCGEHAACGESGEFHTGFLWSKLRERDHVEDEHRWEDNIKVYIKDICPGS